jgi:hypothetical protein
MASKVSLQPSKRSVQLVVVLAKRKSHQGEGGVGSNVETAGLWFVYTRMRQSEGRVGSNVETAGVMNMYAL